MKSFQNIECRKRGYYQNIRIPNEINKFKQVYRQGLSLVSSCGTNLLPLDTTVPARLVLGNQPKYEEPKCYLQGWQNASFGLQRLYDNVTDVFWCQFMRKFRTDGRMERLKIGMSVRFIAGFSVFRSTTTPIRLAQGMTHQLNYTISDTSQRLDYAQSHWTYLFLVLFIIGLVFS